MVLRHRIINRSRDCRLFWMGLGCQYIMVTMKLLRPKGDRIKRKFLYRERETVDFVRQNFQLKRLRFAVEVS